MPRTEGIEKAVATVLDGAMHRVESVGTTLGSLLHLPGMGTARRLYRPGAPAGLDPAEAASAELLPGQVQLRRTDYDPARVDVEAKEYAEEALDVPRPADIRVRWWDVLGLHPRVVDQFRAKLGFHTLAAEDVLHVPQRPRVESYEDHLFVVCRLIKLAGGRASGEQMSFFLFADGLVSFQEDPDDSWGPIRARIDDPHSRLRASGPDFLLYVLLDSVVDHFFPALEQYHELIEDLEDEVLAGAKPEALERIQSIKRDLAVLRRLIWPTRDLLAQLRQLDSPLLTQATKLYLRDVHGHAVQAADALDTLRESANGLVDIYMSTASHRVNATMQLLTIIATIFIPLTFLAGVYGMNFEHIPELEERWAYPAFWMVCLALAGGLIVMFQRRGWLRRS